MILLSDKNSHAWAFSEKIKEYIKKEKGLDVPLEELMISKFRNGESELSGTSSLRGKDVYFIHDSTKTPNDWWVELILAKDLILGSSANSLTFVLPDILYSRKDRKDKSRVPISARALAATISPGVKRIITMDLHAAQIQGFYPENVSVENLYSFPEVTRYLNRNYSSELKNLLILSPDAGGVDRVKAFLTRFERITDLEYDIGFMIKERSKAGEVGSIRYVGPDFKGKNILIVDDIVDSGGTLCKNAERLREGGANKLFCYATHGLFTKGIKELCAVFDKVFTSNTHYSNAVDIEVIDVSQLFAEAIFRTQHNHPISKLFE